MKTRILIVDDHKMFRDGLRMTINHEADMEVVGEAKNGQMAIESAIELQPDVILMDVKMPGIKILALSMYSDNHFISGMMRAGAMGFITKGGECEDLYKVIRKVAVSRLT